ncbi:hypothetical protein ROU88_03490 [Macrococcus capreoli]|uniref:hypothetical protein n=1 Tax=Macrococcus capreoli TaxID=2982690 RepID=UPI0021D5DE1C|nr:hypothetical protein [Macrococcus sp. TMW 2.2395]MCU7558287.1 hypothetical protein [Macrococcus sp. TMW 2.2395]
MSIIVLKTSYPYTPNEQTEYKLIQNEVEKTTYINHMKEKTAAIANETDEPQIIKLEFIYPEDKETYLYKTLKNEA